MRILLTPLQFLNKMAKDPAFLFYYQDFLVGTDEFTNDEVGAYIRCLCHQAHKGYITEKHMKNICNSHDIHNTIKSKFKTDDEGETFYNQRLKFEVEKRKKYSESRANNRTSKANSKKNIKDLSANISKTYVSHMENENENENEISIKKGVDYLNLSISADPNFISEEQKRERMNAIHNELKSSQTFIEDLRRISKMNEGDTWQFVKSFLDSIKAADDFYKPLSEIKRHCVNRLRKFKPEI